MLVEHKPEPYPFPGVVGAIIRNKATNNEDKRME